MPPKMKQQGAQHKECGDVTITTLTVTAAQHGVMNPDGTWTVEEWRADEKHIPESAARAGAAVLDEFRPGWEREVDLSRLNVASPCDCPLGQLYEEVGQSASPLLPFWRGLDAIGITFGSARAVQLGFAISKAKEWRGLVERNERYAELTSAWRDEIIKRRSIDAESENQAPHGRSGRRGCRSTVRGLAHTARTADARGLQDSIR